MKKNKVYLRKQKKNHNKTMKKFKSEDGDPLSSPETELSAAEIQRINEILRLLGVNKVSWLEALAPISNGGLLAKILYKLEENDLVLMCRLSKTIWAVCKRYQLHERFYTDTAYVFGWRGYGDPVAVPQRILNIPKVMSISCGSTHTGIVTLEGEVYMFGNGDSGKLGDGNTDRHSVGNPQRIQGIPKVASISCGSSNTIILTRNRDVYTFGDGTYGQLGDGMVGFHLVGVPQQIQGIPKIASISCSRFHTGLVTTDGNVYMFGGGKDGRLGNGHTQPHSQPNPQKIQNIPRISSISCGLKHTGIITVDGDVYMFGVGNHGQLGDGNTGFHNVGIPQKIQGIPKIASISCGDKHTGIITTGGVVYTFGGGRHGALGDGNVNPHKVGVPQMITNNVVAISCGSKYTGIITTNGDVYMFGYGGGHGRLGDGRMDYHDVAVPQKVQNIPRVASISCSAFQTGIVTIPETSLTLTISCQYCGINQAKYFAFYGEEPTVFCGKKCQENFHK